MAADTATAEQDAKAAKEAERQKKAEEREAERARKAEEREAAKAKKAEEAAAAKAAREKEKVTKVLEDLPEDQRTALGDDVTLQAARDAVKAFKAEQRANRPKKAPLTLSQRRAMLNLAEAGETGVVPKTGFNALPLDYLVGVDLAETFETTRTEKYQETVESEEKIPKAEQEEGGPTTRTVKNKVDKEREVPATGYRLTETGRERAGEVNPKWKTWKPESATPAATEEPAA